MTEEMQSEEKTCKCNCESKCKCEEVFKKLALITTGSFIGCLLALCVYTTFTKPPVPPCARMHYQIATPAEFGPQFHKRHPHGYRQEFQAKKQKCPCREQKNNNLQTPQKDFSNPKTK